MSVLLSTNNKNAHIQLVNHIKISVHHIKNGTGFSSSDSLFLKRTNASLNAQSPKRSTNTQLNALRFTATVSLAIFNTEEIAVHTEKKYAIYVCQSPNIPDAGQIFHHRIQLFSDTTFGKYMYSWLASHAVEYGINEWEKLKK